MILLKNIGVSGVGGILLYLGFGRTGNKFLTSTLGNIIVVSL